MGENAVLSQTIANSSSSFSGITWTYVGLGRHTPHKSLPAAARLKEDCTALICSGALFWRGSRKHLSIRQKHKNCQIVRFELLIHFLCNRVDEAALPPSRLRAVVCTASTCRCLRG